MERARHRGERRQGGYDNARSRVVDGGDKETEGGMQSAREQRDLEGRARGRRQALDQLASIAR